MIHNFTYDDNRGDGAVDILFSLYSSVESLQSPSTSSSSAISIDYSTVSIRREAHSFRSVGLTCHTLFSNLLLTMFHLDPSQGYSTTIVIIPLYYSLHISNAIDPQNKLESYSFRYLFHYIFC